MAGVRVDPPPINIGIVDIRTGKPTAPFIEFMHRLWKRSGGSQDAIDVLDSTNAYPFFRPAGPNDPEDRQPSFVVQQQGASQEAINEAMNNLAALITTKAPESDLIEAIETLRAVTLTSITALHSDIGELRERVDQLALLAKSMASATSSRP